MLDNDLAELYGVETRVLNQAVNRNTVRFPSDFMLQLSDIKRRTWRQTKITLCFCRAWRTDVIGCFEQQQSYTG
ncbi:ORF6N domain-containing protein [Mucilaginibacter sp. SP1R1]|uniref:ORF6N domain-containing protein n=1 Tax=Mucilaginibacter sp. SP1R1 TaxID=2723091 RepID=UPI002103F488|nr:ORF6N domain-containing protein [Mucilaginibacter sp. SP1R1]